MSAPTFTPGPWSIRGAAPLLVEGPPHSKEFPGRPVIANVGGSKPNDAANARLIAAAPVLYAAVEAALERFDDEIHCRPPRRHALKYAQDLRDALAKAVAP